MHTRVLSLLSLMVLLAPASTAAPVNYGDFDGTGIDFLQVTETTTSAGDPDQLWFAPTLDAGNSLSFFPPDFTSACTAGAADVTTSELTTTIVAESGFSLDNLMLTESGDVNLTSFPPFGTAATNASASVSGTVTVIEDGSGPIAPVVIPFSGVFLPTDSFALPGNFGTSLWSANVFVDIASVVPGAVTAEVQIDNVLAANCAAGSTSGKIQKKQVSGPAVALIVNPVECALELDKTCCVTQPVLPDLGQCEGDLESITFEFTGDSCKASNNDQGKAARCYGRRKIGEPADLWFPYDEDLMASKEDDILIGEEITITDASGTLPSKTKIKLKGHHWRKQYLKIDTSCERAIACGDQFGALKVTGFESTLGGVVDCDGPPPPPQCASDGDPAGTPCDAKLVDMVLEYNGQDCQMPLGNPQNGEASCNGDSTGATDVGIVYAGKFGYKQQISPSSGINDGDRIRVTATWWGGLFPNQRYLVLDDSTVVQEVAFHVSCSQPLALGDEFGPFKLVEFTTKAGTTVALGDEEGPFDACEVPLAPPGPHCTDDLNEIQLVYIGDFLGEGCTVSNPQGGYGTCSGVADPGDPVSVSVNGFLNVDPEDQIEFGDVIAVSPTYAQDLPSLIQLHTSGAGGNQSIQIKASCYKPLSLGDRFGSWVVFGMDREDDGPISLGGNIQYQYTVTNPAEPGGDTVGNISIDDDQLGQIASGLSLDPGQSVTVTKNATLFGTTTNVATATGDVDGDFCDPGQDQVTVDVLAPPQGAFHCSAPISEVTMIWDGAQTVDLRVWAGDVGSSAVLNEFDNVQVGDAVEFTGLGGDYPTIEIFNETKTVKLGESSFDLWCTDHSMNSLSDCGKRNGNLKWDYPHLINDWLLEGMVDDDEVLACTPGLVPNPPSCGLGPELMFVLPGLMWLHRRRLRRSA